MNFQFESKPDGLQRITSHTMKTFCDLLSYSLPESSQTRNSTRIRVKFFKETDSQYNPTRTRRLNPTRSRLPQSLQKKNGSTQIGERGSNSQKGKNYRSNRASRSKKTSVQKFAVIIAKSSWPFSRMPRTKKLTPQR